MEERRTMADLVELQRQLNSIEDLLALLVHVSDEKVPQLKNDINDIANKIKGGFDKEELAKQIRTVLNQVINQSDYSKLQANIDTTAKKMIEAIEQSTRQVDRWRAEAKSGNIWSWSFLFFVIGLFMGGIIIWTVQYNRIDRYQYVIDKTNVMAGYINSDCKIKQDFAQFIGQTINCDQSWLSPSTILEKKNNKN